MDVKDGFDQPHDGISGNDIAFGVTKLDVLPLYESIPEEFKRGTGDARKWTEIFTQWFFNGLPQNTKFKVKDGIDERKAMAHIVSVMRSFRPKHEHKTAAVAWLLSRWFDDVVTE